jgi:hypothetical protein
MNVYVKACGNDAEKDQWMRNHAHGYDLSITDLFRTSSGRWVIEYRADYERY